MLLEKVKISSLEEFENEYDEICWKINAVKIGKNDKGKNVIVSRWVTFGGRPIGDATPLIDFQNNKFVYLISERGTTFKKIESEDPYEIMYLIFEGISHTIASDYELKNRIEGQDHRRIMFSKQLEILGRIDSDWKKRCKLDLDNILKKYPYSE